MPALTALRTTTTTSSPSHDKPAEPAVRTVRIEQDLLAKNDHLAARNRGWLAERDMAAVNLMSSPGAGKTSLLERTIRESAGRRTTCVIEGDQETLFDAARIKATGAPVVQINTGAGCHLDADMLRRGLDVLDPADGSLLFVENVGNLVCPALFDLGESAKVVIISVTEGDDKPLKYPHMFSAADLVLVNKTDLLPYVDFDVERCTRDAKRVTQESSSSRCRCVPEKAWSTGSPGSTRSELLGGSGDAPITPLTAPRRRVLIEQRAESPSR
jgi:hydrogenase nickel incorporation protein HypB